jgi:nucleoside-diphosphate kinase
MQPAAARRLAGTDRPRWSMVLLKPYCLERGLIAPVLARIATHADLHRRYLGQRARSRAPPRPGSQPGWPRYGKRAPGGTRQQQPRSHEPGLEKGFFGTGSLTIARSKNRLIDNLIHIPDDPDAVRRDFLTWFGDSRAGLLDPEPATGGPP